MELDLVVVAYWPCHASTWTDTGRVLDVLGNQLSATCSLPSNMSIDMELKLLHYRFWTVSNKDCRNGLLPLMLLSREPWRVRSGDIMIWDAATGLGPSSHDTITENPLSLNATLDSEAQLDRRASAAYR